MSLVILVSASYSIANECLESPRYCEQAITDLANNDYQNNFKYELATKITNSCQYGAFKYMTYYSIKENNIFELALQVNNIGQLVAIKCLAEYDHKDVVKYQYALSIQNTCAAEAICALARNGYKDNEKYRLASYCGR